MLEVGRTFAGETALPNLIRTHSINSPVCTVWPWKRLKPRTDGMDALDVLRFTPGSGPWWVSQWRGLPAHGTHHDRDVNTAINNQEVRLARSESCRGSRCGTHRCACGLASIEEG
jgi:hypothetical protein